jgi:hypothetical protein
MVDMAAIGGALSSIKAASDIANAMLKIHDAKTIQEKTIELNRVILSAQGSVLEANAAQSSLLEHVRSLEKQVTEFEKWDTEKEKYEMREIFSRSFAYAIKESARGSQPEHLICAKCYEDRKKMVLQRVDASHVMCPECKTKIRFTEAPLPTVTRNSGGRGGPNSWMSR